MPTRFGQTGPYGHSRVGPCHIRSWTVFILSNSLRFSLCFSPIGEVLGVLEKKLFFCVSNLSVRNSQFWQLIRKNIIAVSVFFSKVAQLSRKRMELSLYRIIGTLVDHPSRSSIKNDYLTRNYPDKIFEKKTQDNNMPIYGDISSARPDLRLKSLIVFQKSGRNTRKNYLKHYVTIGPFLYKTTSILLLN